MVLSVPIGSLECTTDLLCSVRNIMSVHGRIILNIAQPKTGTRVAKFGVHVMILRFNCVCMLLDLSIFLVRYEINDMSVYF